MSTCKKTHVNMQHLFLMAREHRRVLAQLTFEARQEDAALAHLKEHLSWRVQWGRDTCAGCGQTADL